MIKRIAILLLLSIGLCLTDCQLIEQVDKTVQPSAEDTTEIDTEEMTVDITTAEPTTEEQTTEATTEETVGVPVVTLPAYEEVPENADNGEILADNGHPYCVKVNRECNVVTIYTLDAEGNYTVPYKVMVCSVGTGRRTPRGTYKLQSERYPWRSLVGNVYGQYAVRIWKSIMFHSVPYFRMDKEQLETHEYNMLGEKASKGCIRLSVNDAKWIYDNCERGTYIHIFDSDYVGPMGKPVSKWLNPDEIESQFDPTDIDENSPWYHVTPYIFGAETTTVTIGESFFPMSGISGYDSEGNDITDKIVMSGFVALDTPGTYEITYELEDAKGRVTKVIRDIHVVEPSQSEENESH